jgi:hypothetical protein
MSRPALALVVPEDVSRQLAALPAPLERGARRMLVLVALALGEPLAPREAGPWGPAFGARGTGPFHFELEGVRFEYVLDGASRAVRLVRVRPQGGGAAWRERATPSSSSVRQ